MGIFADWMTEIITNYAYSTLADSFISLIPYLTTEIAVFIYINPQIKLYEFHMIPIGFNLNLI